MSRTTAGTAEMSAVTADMLTPAVCQRIASGLRMQYPRDTVKRAARATGISEGTIKGYLAGQPPSFGHFLKLLAVLGEGFAATVLEPVGSWASDWRLEAEIRAVRERADAIEAELRRLRGRP
jgi:transcriptional regulator with XRE-family HTH domain